MLGEETAPLTDTVAPKGNGSASKDKKNNYSYTYWKRDTPDAKVPAPAPQKIEATAAPVKAPSPLPVAAGVGSAWNQAGTWEDKNVTGKVRDRLKDMCGDITALLKCPANTEIAVSAVDRVEGEATMVFVRGKARLGYELSLRVKWAGTWDGEDVRGSAEVSDLTDHDPDCNVNVKVESFAATAVSSAVRRFLGDRLQVAIKEAMTKIQQELAN